MEQRLEAPTVPLSDLLTAVAPVVWTEFLGL